ncbi:hypothetical protein ACI65C_005541 [Semiaphis heraclei]
MQFDATGGCCRKIKRLEQHQSSHLFLYEGVLEIEKKTFTALSMVSEQHDNLAISTWLDRWLRCGVRAPKMTVCDQSLALMSALVKSFIQFKSLEEYLGTCFKLVSNGSNENILYCYIRNDVNHFIHLICKWAPLTKSEYARTKPLYVRSMALLIFCNTLEEAKVILEAIFKIAFSKNDGLLVNPTEHITKTPCALSKIFLKNLIKDKSHIFKALTSLLIPVVLMTYLLQCDMHNDYNMSETVGNSFQEWAFIIADNRKAAVDHVEGEDDNGQYMPELVPLIINFLKLYPCWSGVFKNENLPTMTSGRGGKGFVVTDTNHRLPNSLSFYAVMCGHMKRVQDPIHRWHQVLLVK